MYIHAGKKPYTCELCEYSTSRIWEFRRHKRIHADEKPFKCELCDYASVENRGLTTHKRVHHGIGLLRCIICLEDTAAYRNTPCRDCRPLCKEIGKEEKRVERFLESCDDERLVHYSLRDKVIPCGVSKRRPDFFWHTEKLGIILEVDEHGHSGYPAECEAARLWEIQESLIKKHGIPQLVVLRFNAHAKDSDECLEECVSMLIDYLDGKSVKQFVSVHYYGYGESRIETLNRAMRVSLARVL